MPARPRLTRRASLQCGLLGPALALLAYAPATMAAERDVQIRSIDFDNGLIELFNFGATDVDLTGWRFCTHDFNQQRRYTAAGGFNAVTIEAGTSVFVHFNNDAPANSDAIDRSTLGGSFATPLDTDAYGLQIFFPASNGSVSFGNSTLIADHLQWNINGSGVGTAEARTNQAVSESLWTAIGDFIATEVDSARIDLTDLSGDEAGGPSEYAVTAADLYDEAVDGDASDDPAAPTALPIEFGSNTVSGEVNLSNDTANGDRDFFTLTVPAGAALTGVDLLGWDTTNPGFIAVNAGATGFIPGPGTDANFLAGVLVDDTTVGDNLIDNFQNDAVTQNSLATDRLGPGDYTFVVQQTTDILQPYALDFVLAETGRLVQIRSIDFTNGIIELFNFGTLDEDLTGWRFCSHDFDQQRRYTGATGLDGITIEAGTSLLIHFNNDAPVSPDAVNRSDLGGSFAVPLDTDAYGLQLFFPAANGSVSFGNSDLIADHLQWNIDGQGAGTTESRTAQAVGEGLWTATGDFIATEAASTTITLQDATGGQAHGPASYLVTTPAPQCVGDVNGDGFTNLADFTILAGNFGSTGLPFGNEESRGLGDLDDDGSVNLADFTILATDFGCTP
ncbi:MAG: dockerin type I domain-containing protein [Planctomycetota bacterium]